MNRISINVPHSLVILLCYRLVVDRPSVTQQLRLRQRTVVETRKLDFEIAQLWPLLPTILLPLTIDRTDELGCWNRPLSWPIPCGPFPSSSSSLTSRAPLSDCCTGRASKFGFTFSGRLSTARLLIARFCTHNLSLVLYLCHATSVLSRHRASLLLTVASQCRACT